MEFIMSNTGVKDYTSDDAAMGNTHYNGVPSWYGDHVAKEQSMQPKYCEPGSPGDAMQGEKRNVQAGP